MVILPVLGRVISRMARMDRRVRLAGILAAENKRGGREGRSRRGIKIRGISFFTRDCVVSPGVLSTRNYRK